MLFRSCFGNFSLNGFVSRIFLGTGGVLPPVPFPELQPLVCVLGLCVILLSGWRFSVVTWDFDLSLSCFVIIMLMVSPITWSHYLVILILPAATLVRYPFSYRLRVMRGILGAAVGLSSMPHWQYYEWLLASEWVPLPGWVLFTSPGFYVLGLVLLGCIVAAHYARFSHAQAHGSSGMLPNV